MTAATAIDLSCRGRIIVAEDDDLVRHTLTRVLTRAGFQVRAVDGGAGVLRAVEERYPCDVVLSDISMPDVDGLEVIRRLRARDLDIPVVLITGHPSPDTAVEAIECGAVGYLRKPLDVEDLLSQVARAKKLHDIARLQRRLRQQDADEDADRADLENRFERALERLRVVFQPVVRLASPPLAGWIVDGWEAFIRSGEPSLQRPHALIHAAVRLGRMRDLGRRARSLSAQAWRTAPVGAKLFLNLHPLELDDPELFGPRSPLTPYAGRIVAEVTERVFLDRVERGHERIRALRGHGFHLAVDDIAHGYASLNTCASIEPDFIKLDRSLVANVQDAPTQARLVSAVADLCDELGAQLIAESVETLQELECLVDLGCTCFQGHLFAAPDTGLPQPVLPAIRQLVRGVR
jgi:EAL domain-containing protein (putative c-di-GMP-specific phosphodiesterase class I)